MSSEARQTIRQARSVVVLRAVMITTGFAYVAIIPRLMGPHTYGQFTLLHSVSFWFTAVSGMGAVSMMTRFVPELLVQNDHAGLRRLASGMLALRVGNGLLGATAYMVVGLWVLRDLPLEATILVALSLALRTVANLPYTLFLGLNQGARWEMGELQRRLFGLALPALGYLAFGLRGACAGLLAAELIVVSMGLFLAREFLDLRHVRIDRAFLTPYLRFSAGFFAGNVFIVLFQQTGPALVRLLAGDYAQAGYYALAFSLYLTITQTMWRLLSTFGPLFSGMHARGEHDQIQRWVEQLTGMLGVVGVAGLAFVHTHGQPVIRVIAGKGYEPVAPLLTLLAGATLLFIPGGLARLLAVTYGKAESSISSAAAQLAVFAAACFLLVPKLGSVGAGCAVLLSALVFAGLGTLQMRRALPYSLKTCLLTALLGAVLSPVLWLWDGPPTLRLLTFLAAFTGLLTVLRIADWREWLHTLRRA